MSDFTRALINLWPLAIILGATFYFRRRRILREKAEAKEDEALRRYLDLASAANLDQEREPDWRSLRAAYIRSPVYMGYSRFDDRDDVHVDDEKKRSSILLLRDYPLLSTQMDAAEYFKQHPEEFGPGMHDLCVTRFHQLAHYIEGTGRDSAEGRIYPVLSIDEEYAFLMWRGLMPSTPDAEFQQSLVTIDGKPHDRIETGETVILFDISAFYERQALAALQRAGQPA